MATTKPPRKNLRDVDRAIITAVMFEQGIVPMEQTTLDMRRVLEQLPPEEARKMRRKFRKLWRRAMEAEAGPPGKDKPTVRETRAKAHYGAGKVIPSRSERNARKQLVFSSLWRDCIEPLIRSFENAGGPPIPKPNKSP